MERGVDLGDPLGSRVIWRKIRSMKNSLLYLDHNASTPVFPEVVEAMRACWATPYLNPSSQHQFGQAARRVLEETRERVAVLLGAETTGATPDRVVFTSGGTEANNLALRGLLSSCNERTATPHVLASAIEHSSINSLLDDLERTGYVVERVGATADGTLCSEDFVRRVRPETCLVTAMLANNETGVIQPIGEVAAACRARGVSMHTDAAQAAGKLAIRFGELGVSTLSIAAHKFGGPMGIGALVVRHGARLAPQLLGGHQQGGLRAGTESVPLAVGLCTALEQWQAHRERWHEKLRSLRDRFESLVCGTAWESRQGEPNLQMTSCQPVVVAAGAERMPHTTNIAFVGLDRQALFVALDQAGIACSTGSACASGSSEPSHVLVSMGLPAERVASALRFSIGVSTEPAEVEEAARRILKVCNGLGR